MTESKRLFVAAPVRHLAVATALTDTWKRVLRPVPEDVVLTREAHPHITLSFIGELDVERQQDRLVGLLVLLDSIAESFVKLPLQLGQVGTFTSGHIWTAVEGDGLDGLHALQRLVDVAVRGVAARSRSFTPHITLGKVKDWVDIELSLHLLRADDGHDPEPVHFEIGSFELLETVKVKRAGVSMSRSQRHSCSGTCERF